MAGLNVMLLTTTGRRTGKKRTAPLGYFEYEGMYVVIASNGGADRHPAWFLNLKANSEVNMRIRDKEVRATAKPAEAVLRAQLWSKLISLSPHYGQYETRTKREIPVVVLNPAS